MALRIGYRAHKKTRHEQRAERVEALAGKLELARAAVLGGTVLSGWEEPLPPPDILNIGQADVRKLLRGQLPPGRTLDLQAQMMKAGLPL